MDQKEKNKRQRESRVANNNAHTKKYEKTKNGFLMRVYRNMKSRISGVQWRKAHLYSGKSLMGKEDFYEWSKADKSFHDLFEAWESSGYERRLTPSIDRIDPSKGYESQNVQWVPFHDNCRRGANSRNKKDSC